MVPATALNIPSAFLMHFGDGSELRKCHEEDSSRTMLLLPQEESSRKVAENQPQGMSLLGLHRILDQFTTSRM